MSTPIPPKNPTDWKRNATYYGVANKPIDHLKFTSASTFKFPNYLSLRALVQQDKPALFKPEEFGLTAWLDQAKQELAPCPSWKMYCSSFNETSRKRIPRGTFGLVRFYQLQVIQGPDKDKFEFPVVSPISSRTRRQERINDQEVARAEELARAQELIQKKVSLLEIHSLASPAGQLPPSTRLLLSSKLLPSSRLLLSSKVLPSTKVLAVIQLLRIPQVLPGHREKRSTLIRNIQRQRMNKL